MELPTIVWSECECADPRRGRCALDRLSRLTARRSGTGKIGSCAPTCLPQAHHGVFAYKVGRNSVMRRVTRTARTHDLVARCMTRTTPTAATNAIAVSTSKRRFRVRSAVSSGSSSARYRLPRTNCTKAIEWTDFTRKAAHAVGWRSRMRTPARRRRTASTGRTTRKYGARTRIVLAGSRADAHRGSGRPPPSSRTVRARARARHRNGYGYPRCTLGSPGRPRSR